MYDCGGHSIRPEADSEGDDINAVEDMGGTSNNGNDHGSSRKQLLLSVQLSGCSQHCSSGNGMGTSSQRFAESLLGTLAAMTEPEAVVIDTGASVACVAGVLDVFFCCCCCCW